MNRQLSVIFDPEPENWVYQGDPYLWRELREAFAELSLPVDADEFFHLLWKKIHDLVGENLPMLEPGCGIYVERYDVGKGKSSGDVNRDFWVYKAIPLLRQRLETVNQAL